MEKFLTWKRENWPYKKFVEAYLTSLKSKLLKIYYVGDKVNDSGESKAAITAKAAILHESAPMKRELKAKK